MTEQDFYQAVLAIGAALGLSASCGFRVFVPPLAMCIASRAGFVQLDAQWAAVFNHDWSLVVLALAALIELGAYCIPWLDHFLDVVAAPAAFVAGTFLTASCVTSIDPVFQWALAAIVGGGSATLIHIGTATVRAGSTMTTGGLGNPVVAGAEAATATLGSLLAIVAPLLAGAVVLFLIFVSVRSLVRRRARRTKTAP